MKVCVDIQSAIGQRAGVGRYTKSLVEHLGDPAGSDELILFYFDFSRRGHPFPVMGARRKVVRWCPGRLVQKAWKTIGWPPFDRFSGPADVYHFPNFVRPPLTCGRSVVTLHDIAFLRLPETTERKNLRYLSAQIRKTVDQSDMIITVSQFSAREICEQLNVPEDRVTAIHEGLTPNMASPDQDAIKTMRRALNLNRPYLLFVGTIEPRKNIPFLVDVFERLESFDGDLVLAGMRGWKYEPILERMKRSRRAVSIRYLEYVDEQWMPALYAGSELFLFPSLYEGFGFPPLEAMMCGTPVLSSTAGSLPEVLGDAAEWAPQFDPELWKNRVETLLGDDTRRETLRKAGRAQAGRYRWADTARKTWEVYRKVGGK